MQILHRNERLVKKKHPAAHIMSDLDGNVFVRIPNFIINESDDNEDISEYVPAHEYYMPLTRDIPTAWDYAATCLRITQNFNRTHPQRILDEDFDQRLERIMLRQQKNNAHVRKKQKEQTKN